MTAVDERKTYPGVCFDPWASACGQLARNYSRGVFPHHSGVFIEADGYPLAVDWIDQLKRAHAETLLLGKRVTGPRMRHDLHINGTLIMHWSCWLDHPSLQQCPADAAWDIFHGQVLCAEAGPSQVIANRYGDEGMSERSWFSTSINAAWGTSGKDGLGQFWARRKLVQL